ncbi:MAG: YdcF family protein [bacterium]
MKRDNFSQLPNSTELQKILDAEVKRNIPVGNEEKHYVDFSALVKLAEHFEVGAEIITDNYTKIGLKKQDLLEKGKILIEKLKEKLLNGDLSLEDIGACNVAYDYLAENDVVEKADIMFVFGAKTPLRIEKAVELYQQGLAQRIIVSGRSPHYAEEHSVTEAETYARIAVEKGVPANVIMVENKSITIPDNVRSSLNFLDESGISYSSIILVNSPYTQRRGWAHFKKYLPDTVKLIRVNSRVGDQYRRDAWYKSPIGIDVVLGEYIKAKVAVSLNTA